MVGVGFVGLAHAEGERAEKAGVFFVVVVVHAGEGRRMGFCRRS
jgi:hypothetical protein